MDKKQIIHISTVLCYNSNDKHRPRRILGFAGLQSGTTWSGFTSIEFWWLKWKTSEIEESGLRNFDDFVIKYLLFSHQNTFCSPSDTIFEIENLVLNKRNESNLGIEVTLIVHDYIWLYIMYMIAVQCFTKLLEAANVDHEVMKLLKWIDRKAEQYSFIWKILFYCNLL